MIQRASALTVTTDVVVMLAATSCSTRSYPHCAIATIRWVGVCAWVVKGICELHTALFVRVFMCIAYRQPWIGEAGQRGHARCSRVVVLTATVRLVCEGWVRFVNEGCVGIRRVRLVDCARNLRLEDICLGRSFSKT
jgi:hypothetical protein